jgi:molybdenum cofactor cytidylyltransferase
VSIVAGVVLGAGLSERMGRPKQLLPYGDTTLLGAVVANAEASRLDPVVVVVGAAAVEVEAALRPARARLVRNLRYHEGNLSSLRTGVAAVGPHDAVMLLLGDMPQVDAGLIDHVRDAWLAAPCPLLVTRYRDGVGHPFVLGAATTARLDELEEPKALWRLTQETPDLAEVAVGRDRPRDVDTPEDYEQLLAETGEAPPG